MLLPVVSFAAVFVLFYDLFYAQSMGVDRISYFAYLNSGWMWFLKYLFVCSVIAYASKKIFRSDVWALLPVVVLLFLTRSNVFRLLPFLWLGYFIYKYKDTLLDKHLRVTLWGGLAVFAFFLYFWKGDYDAPIRFLYLKHPVHIDWGNCWGTFVRLGVGMSGSLFFIALFKALFSKNASSSRLVSFCTAGGQNTLGIYCMQIYILEFGLDHINWHFGYTGDVVTRILLSVVILLICDGLVRLMGMNQWTAFFFLGRNFKK